MHYIHRLGTAQKRIVIFLFLLVPLLFFVAIIGVWSYKQGLFSEQFTLKTIAKSADGIDTTTPVTFSGIKIGRVTKIELNDDNAIEITLKIRKKYQHRIHKNATASLGSLVIFGKKKIAIYGGSKDLPVILPNSTVAMLQEDLEVENIMERLKPLINASERGMLKLVDIVETFPNEEMNKTVIDMQKIVQTLQRGESSIGKLAVTDQGKLYKKLDDLMGRVDKVSKDLEKASKHFPQITKDAEITVGNFAVVSQRVRNTSKEINIDETQKILLSLLKNLNKTVEALSGLGPTLKKTVESVGDTADELKMAAPKIPIILDDIETALREYLILVRSIKASWPMKNLVPPEKQKQKLKTPNRKTPYSGKRK